MSSLKKLAASEYLIVHSEWASLRGQKALITEDHDNKSSLSSCHVCHRRVKANESFAAIPAGCLGADKMLDFYKRAHVDNLFPAIVHLSCLSLMNINSK